MLKHFLSLLLLLCSFQALACWRVKATVGIDGETWKIDQKVGHNKEYDFPIGNFILKMTLVKGDHKNHQLVYKLQEKQDLKLKLVTAGQAQIQNDEEKDIFAKGVEGQPNSIITIKLMDI